MAAYSDDRRSTSVFRALADPSRRRLLDSLNARNGQTLRELCAGIDMARQSVSKHLAVLEAANLVTSVRRGREKLHYLNAAPINEIAERWINRYDQARVEALADLKRALEDTPMDKPAFVYTTYIQTTPERLWQALTEPGVHPALLGPRVRHRLEGRLGDDVGQPRRARSRTPSRSCSRPTPSAGCRTPGTPSRRSSRRPSASTRTRRRAARASRARKVTFELEPAGEPVKLTVVHDGFAADSVDAD